MKKYNGWTNYETWRINLEIFDGFDCDGFDNSDDLSDYLKEYLEEYIKETSTGIAQDYALAFISEVNYLEIAETLLND
jgi:hypothetical protein